MKLNIKNNGLEALFKPWQVPLIHELFKRGSMNSGKAWTFLVEQNVMAKSKPRPISRASVINFLNDMVDNDLLDFSLKTGKGGHHRVYKMIFTREEFAHEIIEKFIRKIIEVFPEESKSFTWHFLKPSL